MDTNVQHFTPGYAISLKEKTFKVVIADHTTKWGRVIKGRNFTSKPSSVRMFDPDTLLLGFKQPDSKSEISMWWTTENSKMDNGPVASIEMV